MIRLEFKTMALALLLPVSITNLYADTNSPQTAPMQTLQNPLETADSPLVQCRTFAESLEMIIGMIFNIKSVQGPQLINCITSVLTICSEIKEIPDTATAQDLYKGIATLGQSCQYLTQLLEKGADQSEEFAPNVTAKETISPDDLMQEFKTLDGNFDALLAKVDESYQDVLGTLSMHVNNQLNKLDTILQTVNTNISNNSTIVNKADIKKDIMDLRNILQQIKKELALAGSNPQSVLGIYQANKTIINYLKDAQKHKFRKWVILDLVNDLLRGQAIPDQMLEEVLYDMMRTNFELDQLEKEAEKIDLTIVNKTARFIGDYIVDPIQKYDLGLWSLTAAATAGVGTYAAYFFDQTFFPKPDSLFRKIFGYRNHQAGKQISFPDKQFFAAVAEATGLSAQEFGERVKKLAEVPAQLATSREDHLELAKTARMLEMALNQTYRHMQKPLVPISKIDEFIYDHKTGAAAVGIGLIGLATYCYYKIWKDNKNEWSKKIFVWFNKLKGGSYIKLAEKYDTILSTITFDDVIGMEYEKEQVYPHLKYIKDPERWDANELAPHTGILLTGPTRTGKTFFAKAICGELHKQNPDKTIRFISIDAHDIKAEGIATWIGVAKMLAPCVLFIDEIDLLGLQRTKDATLLADFLGALSGIADKDPKKRVIVVGTTNKPENIDPAMIQTGRLALEIRFKYPNLQERKLFIQKRLDKFAINPTVFDIDVNKLAQETQGKSFEDLRLMLDCAFIHVGIKGSVISQEVLENALDVQLRKIIYQDSKEISTDEKQLLSAHYAGQTLAHILLNLDEKIAKVTTRQIVVKMKEESVWSQFEGEKDKDKEKEKQTGLEQGAIFTYREHDSLDIKNQSLDQLAKKAKTLLAGRIAERLITNTCSSFFGAQKNQAFNMIRSIVADGIDIRSLSKSGQNKISDETQAQLKAFEHEVEQLLLEHKDALVALTNALQEEQTLSIGQIMKVISKAEGRQIATAQLSSPDLQQMIAAVA